jgi:hypothetical protein
VKKTHVGVALCATTLSIASGASALDFGQKTAQLAQSMASRLFGVQAALLTSSSTSLTADQANANPTALVTAARGLRVSVVSAHPTLGPNIDMMALWPNASAPTHLIACNEQGASNIGVQRIPLTTGVPETIISSGLTSCDPVRITPWGTVLVGEENGANGRVFEIIDPLNTTGVTVTGSGATTAVSDTAHVAFRGALGMLSYEGIALMPNGVTYYSDENRPGASGGNPGGAIFKFIPSALWAGGAPITDLAQSPFASGSIFGMRLGRNSGNTDFGQGNEFGRGVWVEAPASSNAAPTNLRAAAVSLKLTSYYRPEDMDLDLAAIAAGNVRFCGANTGQDSPGSDNHFGEIWCVTDGTLAQAGTVTRTTQTVGSATYTLNTGSIPEYQPLVIGNLELGMPDNIAYQPGTGNFLVHEDGDGPTYASPRNNDIWACLDDGEDEDNLSDACIRVMTLNDLTAESTGGLFDATGRNYYFSVQHNITGHGVILKVSGWRNVEEEHHGWKHLHDHDSEEK